jgi:hypothetical protein
MQDAPGCVTSRLLIYDTHHQTAIFLAFCRQPQQGNGCCHGITGSAYALLRLYHTTKKAKWLHRAVQFAEFMSRWAARWGLGIMSLNCQGLLLLLPACCDSHPPLTCSEEFLTGARTPDHPLSLYEGSAAEVCLYADLLGDPTRAGFPLFEVDI